MEISSKRLYWRYLYFAYVRYQCYVLTETVFLVKIDIKSHNSIGLCSKTAAIKKNVMISISECQRYLGAEIAISLFEVNSKVFHQNWSQNRDIKHEFHMERNESHRIGSNSDHL